MGKQLTSADVPRLVSLNPQKQAASQTVISAYAEVSKGARILARFNAGDLDSGGITCSLMQEKADGSGAKALSAGGFAPVTTITNGAKVELEGQVELLDIDNDFCKVALKVVTSGAVAAGAYFAADLIQLRADFVSGG